MDCLNDNEVLALVTGQIGAERRAEIDLHLDGCAACRELIAATAQASDEAPRPAARALQLGRYSVLHPLGAGAMGVVYAAYDPELDRRIALKLLHAGDGDANALRTRLLREAQAMARLSHPNVIAVHDVGTVQGQVFVAMEFVEGKTLTAWVSGDRRLWRETLRVFILAGRGLAAAHAAGVVHRDFKPDNVLVGNDGRVRVTDFGLARSEQKIAIDSEGLAAVAAGTNTLTEAGALVGSPAYMAPEQMRGEKVDARADQFSFCVALYEALYGERPFAGEDLRAIAGEIEQRRIRKEPDGTRVPGWVRRVVIRGLAPKIDDRYPTLEALLEALQADPAVRWRRLGAALGVLALVAGAALLVRWQGNRAAQTCRGGEQKLSGVWDAQLRSAAKAAFQSSGLPYAADSWTLVERGLDRYANGWTAMRTDACEATAVRREQSPELLDLRMACLDDRLASLGAASALLSSADKSVVERAINVVSGLPSLVGCADAGALRAPGEPAPAIKAQVEGLRDRIARMNVLCDAGKPVVEMALQLEKETKALGYAPLEAEALYALGHDQAQSGDMKSAEQTLTDATAAALAAKNDSYLARSWLELLEVQINLSHLDAARTSIPQAKAAVNRMGSPSWLQIRLLVALAYYTRVGENNLEEAQRYGEQAVALLDSDTTNESIGVNTLSQLGLTLGARAKWDEADAVMQRAFKIATAFYGPEHPVVGEMEEELANILSQREHFAEAQRHLEHALHTLEGALGRDHPAVAEVLKDLGNNAVANDPARALGYLQRAYQIQLRAVGNDNTSVVFTRYLIGCAQHAEGQLELGRKTLEEAKATEWSISHNPDDLELAMINAEIGAIYLDEGKVKAAHALIDQLYAAAEKGYGPSHPQTAEALALLARVALAEKRLDAARKLAERSIELARLDVPGDTQASIERELVLAQIFVAQGKTKEARALLERIVRLPAESATAVPGMLRYDRPRARFLLAQTLWPDAGEHPRALELARQAHDEYATERTSNAKDRDELEHWLAAHPN